MMYYIIGEYRKNGERFDRVGGFLFWGESAEDCREWLGASIEEQCEREPERIRNGIEFEQYGETYRHIIEGVTQ